MTCVDVYIYIYINSILDFCSSGCCRLLLSVSRCQRKNSWICIMPVGDGLNKSTQLVPQWILKDWGPQGLVLCIGLFLGDRPCEGTDFSREAQLSQSEQTWRPNPGQSV
jgi:hypothetical protein